MLIDHLNSKPIYEQIILEVKKDILKGILLPNEKLPSVRDLASQLLINPNTISKAYKELEAQGAIHTVKGKGTYVVALSDSRRDEQIIENIKKELTDLVLEATYQKVEKQELISWINSIVESLGGVTNEN